MTIFERYKALGEGKMIHPVGGHWGPYRVDPEYGLQVMTRLNKKWSQVGNEINIIDDINEPFELYTEPIELHDWEWVLQQPEGTKVRWHDWIESNYRYLKDHKVYNQNDIDITECCALYQYFTQKGWLPYND